MTAQPQPVATIELSRSRISGEIALLRTDELDMITHEQWLDGASAAAYMDKSASLFDNHLDEHKLDTPEPYQSTEWRTLRIEPLGASQ